MFTLSVQPTLLSASCLRRTPPGPEPLWLQRATWVHQALAHKPHSPLKLAHLSLDEPPVLAAPLCFLRAGVEQKVTATWIFWKTLRTVRGSLSSACGHCNIFISMVMASLFTQMRRHSTNAGCVPRTEQWVKSKDQSSSGAHQVE